MVVFNILIINVLNLALYLFALIVKSFKKNRLSFTPNSQLLDSECSNNQNSIYATKLYF